MDGWAGSLVGAAEAAAQAAALGLGLPRDAFLARMRGGPHLLAPTGSDLLAHDQPGTVLAGFHVDLNFLTVHGKSRFSGLRVWTSFDQNETHSRGEEGEEEEDEEERRKRKGAGGGEEGEAVGEKENAVVQEERVLARGPGGAVIQRAIAPEHCRASHQALKEADKEAAEAKDPPPTAPCAFEEPTAPSSPPSPSTPCPSSSGSRGTPRAFRHVLVPRIPPGCLLMQAGLQFEALTGGVVTAGPHEVLVTSDAVQAARGRKARGLPAWRVSSTLFAHVASDQILEPLGGLGGERAKATYPAEPAGAQVQRELRAIALSKS